jgi:hypothetical protein
MPTHTQNLTKALNSQKKQTSYAWSRVYAGYEENLELHTKLHATLTELELAGVPEHITRELMEMAETLRLEIACPICLENLTKETIHISKCGHKYCKDCYKQLTEQPEPKCAVCRKKIWVKRG